MKLRDDVNKSLEIARSEKIVGKPLDAKITLFVSDEAKGEFEQIRDQNFETIFITSKVDVVYGEGEGYRGDQFKGVTVKVEAYDAPKCARCWVRREDVGGSADHPELCPRCIAAIQE